MIRYILLIFILLNFVRAGTITIVGTNLNYMYTSSTVIAAINTNEVLSNFCKISMFYHPNRFVISTSQDLTESQTNILYTIITNNGIPLLLQEKLRKIKEMQDNFEDTMISKYTLRQQISFISLYLIGLDKNKTIRKGYLYPAFEWLELGFDYMYSNVDNILALTNITDVSNYQWDWSTLLTQDPKIDIREAKDKD